MRAIVSLVLAAGLMAACGSDSEKPKGKAAVDNRAVRERYVSDLSDVERQLGCGIAEAIERQGESERHFNRFLRRMANTYAKASRRLAKLHPPADAVAPNANLAKSLSNVADTLRAGVIALTDNTGRIPPGVIEDTLLPPAAEKALDQLDARGYPGDFEAGNCDDADLLSPSTKA
jgi:hypothetical protein